MKKFFISLLLILFMVFSFTFCFANDGNGLEKAANNVRNFVGGVENTVENAAMDVSNTSKDMTKNVENGMSTAGNTITNSMSSNNYSSTRTSTRSATNNDNTIMGMSSTAWTWIILGIVAIAIVTLVWYYSMQITNNSNNND